MAGGAEAGVGAGGAGGECEYFGGGEFEFFRVGRPVGEELGDDVVFCPGERCVFRRVVEVVGAPDGGDDCAVGVESGVD